MTDAYASFGYLDQRPAAFARFPLAPESGRVAGYDGGFDPATIERSAGVNVEHLLTDAEGLVALGVTLLTVGVNGPDYDLKDAEALCRWRDRA